MHWPKKFNFMPLVLAVLLGLLMAPHELFGAEADCPACSVGLKCQDLCDCSGQEAPCSLEVFHQQGFRNDSTPNQSFTPAPLFFIHRTLGLEASQPAIKQPLLQALQGCTSFAVRHLDTIILRI